jgi:hypothetical protein
MRHARPEDLDRINALLARLRTLDGMLEKKRGVFYVGSKSFLHFHEDPAGMFADLAVGAGFERFRVTTADEQRAFVKAVREALTSHN